jgi:hypothetical protein
MANQPGTKITKSDFRLYCDAPRHLWAKENGKIASQASDFDQHLAEEGNRVERIAQEYLSTILISQNPGTQLLWQQTFIDGPYEARLDALVLKANSNNYDLYEIKSSTGVDKDIVYDVTFQAAILEKQINVAHYYVLHLNKGTIRSGELDLATLFLAEDVSEKVRALNPEVLLLREEALRVAQCKDFAEAEACLLPKDCPCLEICHPGLPEFSIYDIPRLTKPKKIQLLEQGILAAKDIPACFDLNKKQRLVVERARTNTEHIDRAAIRAELERLQYPLWFLDYETCISAIPLNDGYHPQQQVVFQYSLHKLDQPGGELQHFGHVAIPPGDPTLALLEHLSSDLGPGGTVIVWNKAFEMTMNTNMAGLHPEYAGFLQDVNARIYDLADIVNFGYYIHPGFKGSWSLKHVLPVMVPELRYEEMAINKGDQASLVWWNITFGNLADPEKETLIENLKKYCRLDTLAMVEIIRKLEKLLSPHSTPENRGNSN